MLNTFVDNYMMNIDMDIYNIYDLWCFNNMGQDKYLHIHKLQAIHTMELGIHLNIHWWCYNQKYHMLILIRSLMGIVRHTVDY